MTDLLSWRRHHLGLDAVIVRKTGVYVLCPVCCRELTLDADVVTCPRCGSMVRVTVTCREAKVAAEWAE